MSYNVRNSSSGSANTSVSKGVNSGVASVSKFSLAGLKARLPDFRTLFSENMGVVVAIVVVMLLFVAVIVFILREINGNNSLKSSKTLTTQIIKMNDIDSPVEVLGSEIPRNKVGNQYTFSFWTYLNGFSQTPGFHKLVFYRGERETVQTANPIVMFDEISNKLHFVVKTEGSSLSSTNASVEYKNLKPIIDRNYYANKNLKFDDLNTNKHLVLTVNSVPFNRWVHFAVAIRDNIITLYQDGEIYAVKTTNDFVASKPTEYDQRGNIKNKSATISIDSSEGSVYIGRNAAIGGKNSIDGYFSKLNYAGYAMTISDIYKEYKKGPFQKNWLSSIGIDSYGIQYPLYKLKAVA